MPIFEEPFFTVYSQWVKVRLLGLLLTFDARQKSPGRHGLELDSSSHVPGVIEFSEQEGNSGRRGPLIDSASSEKEVRFFF